MMVRKGKDEVGHNEPRPVITEYKPRVLYPNRQGKTAQTNNLMLNAVKFLKELLENKRKLDEASHVELNSLDEWWTHKPRKHDKPKPRHDELNSSQNQLKVGDKVLLDAVDPQIATSEPNEETPLTVISIFPYGTVEVNHPKFGTFKGKIYSPTQDTISCHSRGTWPWAKLPKQHGRATCPYLETMVETENVTRMSPQGISSMLSMRMIKKRRGTYPPQYRLAQSTEEEDPKDITDDVPPRHKDPLTQPPTPSRPSSKAHHRLGTKNSIGKVLHDCHALLDHDHSLFEI
ncbi:hypothetical protein GOBAR_AA03098 [Gossypium barbadense]|uniref:Uncharacterized protein n=1 Tax=Gossypium barbadense TaxID=3634 RepID=A0A2P5YPG2_GOSBA|nr:hypothetical protein GOBAR_AA03098 [Gossypium barbadense]